MADNKSEDSLPTSVRRPTPIAGKVPVTKAAIPPATLPNVSEESESLKGRRDTPMAMNASPAELKKLKTPKCSTLSEIEET